ncbi:MAG TPA: zinc-ribbon domain-containing protein [Acidimicrobiia bacterium]|nr:zinc-ribbon domain-containing protein [Acidimicrobiia bacterium]
MARHVCPECGATVTGEEQFCPTCGVFLGYDEESAGHDEYEQFELGSEPPPPPPGGRRSAPICPSCGAENAPGNRHCEECGARLSQGPLPAAPRPAVQATAGVRAVIAIGGLLLGIILIALLFQLFSGDDDPTATTAAPSDTSSTTVTIQEVGVLDPLDVQCSIEGLGSFVCSNLISDSDALYQVNWEELEASGDTLTITIRFRTAVAINRIDWRNISNDDTRFQRNYRARALAITSDDSLVDVQTDLQNIPGTQSIDFSSVNTNQVTIVVNSAWPAQLIDGNVFSELAIDEIQVIGRPAATAGTTATTAPDTTETTETTEGGDS